MDDDARPCRNEVAIELPAGPWRERILGLLHAFGIDTVTDPPEERHAEFRVVVTDQPSDVASPPSVVVHVPDNGEPYGARLVTGQWVRLDGLLEAADFIRQVSLENDADAEG